MMVNSLDSAIKILTGREAPAFLLDKLKHIEDPLEIRKEILRDPRLFNIIPEFRMAFEILALRQARASGSIKLVIGAAGTSFSGWVSTNENLLNLLRPDTWRAWLEENSVEAMLSEHVWEHLDLDEGEVAARTCFKFLAPGKRLRIAVPDSFHPDKEYLELCKVGGHDEHKVFYNHGSLSEVLRKAGFKTELLEFWDETGNFNYKPWSSLDGHIGRSSKNDHRNVGGTLNFTSLIIDAYKSLD